MVKRENIDELSIGTSDRIANIEGTNLSIDQSGNLNASAASGGEGHIVEDFADGTITDYSGHTDAFGVVSGNIVGGNMIQFDGSVRNTANAIATTNTTTRRGMAYASYIRPGSSTDLAAGLVVNAGTSSGTVDEGYLVNMRATGDTFALDYKTSSSGWLANTLGTASATINGGTLYRIEVALSPSYIDCRLINVDTATEVASVFSDAANATALNSGGWGYYGSSDASVTADFDFGTRTPDMWVV